MPKTIDSETAPADWRKTTAPRPPTAVELKTAYDGVGGDAGAPETAPALRERRMAWDVAAAFAEDLPNRGGILRSRIRAERDYLEAHLARHRVEMPPRVADEFERAIDALYLAVDALALANPR